MFGDEFGHFKHIDRFFAVKHFLQVAVGVDVASIGRILKIVAFNIDPKIFDDLRTGHWTCADYCRQFRAYI